MSVCHLVLVGPDATAVALGPLVGSMSEVSLSLPIEAVRVNTRDSRGFCTAYE